MSKAIYQYLDSVGDGSGVKDHSNDHSATPFQAKFTNKVGRTTGVAIIERMIIGIRDTGAFDAEKYGNGVTLTNGIELTLRNSADEVIETYIPIPIKSNTGWAMQCHDLNHHNFGTGDEIATLRWTFSKAGRPIYVDVEEGNYLSLDLNDDFSGLEGHFFQIQGQYK